MPLCLSLGKEKTGTLFPLVSSSENWPSKRGPLLVLYVYIDNDTSHSKNTVGQLGNETNTATNFTQGEKRIAEGSQTAKETSKGLLTN